MKKQNFKNTKKIDAGGKTDARGYDKLMFFKGYCFHNNI